MDLKTTLYEVVDGVALITLNRPHRANAWTGRMHTEYRHLLGRADTDPAIGAIIVTGAGERFCVGGDSQALDGHADRGGYDSGTTPDIETPGSDEFGAFREDFAYHFALSKPVIAAVNGAAAGVGLVLACYADIRFIAAHAKLTTAHGPLNMPAEYGLSWLLPRLIGGARATELLISSRVFLGEEAGDIGLAHRVLPAPDVLPAALDYAKDLIARVSPRSLEQSKRQVYLDYHRDVGAAVRDAGRLLDEMVAEPDFKEGIRAFLEKRPPQWAREGD